jgi:hypothetical protein
LFPVEEAAMRNLAMAVMLLFGLTNVDHLYYQDKMLKPVYSMIWHHVQGLLSA